MKLSSEEGLECGVQRGFYQRCLSDIRFQQHVHLIQTVTLNIK